MTQKQIEEENFIKYVRSLYRQTIDNKDIMLVGIYQGKATAK